MRVAFHAINGVGLGHLVRTLCLAREVRALDAATQILFLTNARDVSLLERDGFDYIHFPLRLAEPHADPDRIFTGLPEDLDHAAALSALAAFAPDLVVFDTHAPPPVVRGAADLGARTVLVLRELRPDAFRRWLESPAALEFDRILVPHEPAEIDPTALPDGIPVALVGPIVRALPPPTRNPTPHLVVLAGGGGQPVDALRYLRAAADAHWLARARFPDLSTTLIAGPHAGRIDPYPGLTILPATPDAPDHLARADLVVSQAGYNAIAEIRALRKPAILVPGFRRMEDQSARARRLARLGAAVIAQPDARSIADRIESLLARDGARLARMARAHERRPLVLCNRAAALAALRPLQAPAAPVRRVVLVAHDFPPRIGGMETVAKEVSVTLARQGLDVLVYTSRRIGACEVPGVRVRPLFTPLRDPHNIDLLRDLLLTLNALLADAPDAVHLCHAGLAPWIPALRAAWPALYTVNVHGNDLLSPWVHSGAPDDVYRSALHAGLRAADRVLPVSDFSSGLARSAGVDPARIRKVPNGVDAHAFVPAAVESAEPILLTVSRLAQRKGHATVLRALPKLPQARYLFTGVHDRIAGSLHHLARSLGVADRVQALGFVPAGELPALFQQARAFVLVPENHDPADVEGFGVALLEAAAAGLPVVASHTGGVPEAVEDGVTGFLVPPGDPSATADALRRLLDDPVLARRMGERGRERAIAHFSWGSTCARLRSAWDGTPAPPAELETLRTLTAGEPHSGYPHVLALRDVLHKLRNPSELARLARLEARELRAESERRRETYRRSLERGKRLRLRATGDGERILPAALADCRALAIAPDVEMRLRRFLDPDFRAHALLAVGDVFLHHSVPAPDPQGILRAVAALPDDQVARIRSLRIHLALEARSDPRETVACVPEIHAVRETLSRRGVAVLPPPELMRYLSVTPAGTPPTAMIEPTNHCNLACPTCPTGTGKIRPTPDLTPERFAAALDGLAPTLRNLALWNYGEPTLNRHLPQMIAHAKQRGVGVVKVSSNVHFLNGDRGAALLESGLDVLILSVDGASQETYARFRQHGDFAKVAAAVRSLCEEKRRRGLTKPRIELQFIAMKHNEHELPAIRALAADWGVDRLRIKTFGAEDDVNRELVPQTPELSRYEADHATPNRSHPFCTMAWDHTVINVDGSVTPCCYLRPDLGARFVMGNVFDTPFAEIWRGEKYRAFRAAILRDRAAMPICGRCRGGTHDLLAAVEEVTP